MSHQHARAEVGAAHQAARGEPLHARAQRRLDRAACASSSASKSDGVKTNMPVSSASQGSRSLPIDVIRSRLMRTLVASAAMSGSAGSGVDRQHRVRLVHVELQQPPQHRRFEQVVAHQQREPVVPQVLAGGKGRDAVLEMPVGVVDEPYAGSGRRCALDERPDAIGLVAKHDAERRDAGRGGRFERSKDQRLPEDGV